MSNPALQVAFIVGLIVLVLSIVFHFDIGTIVCLWALVLLAASQCGPTLDLALQTMRSAVALAKLVNGVGGSQTAYAGMRTAVSNVTGKSNRLAMRREGYLLRPASLC